MFKNPNETTQKELNTLYAVSRDQTLSKHERKLKIKILRQSLRNAGILSLPFSLNPKKIKLEKENG